TTRRLRQLRGGRHPIKGVFARPVLLQMVQPRNRLLYAGTVSGAHPPHHKIWSVEMLEPLGAAAIEAPVDRLIDEALEGLDVFPDRQIDSDAFIGIRPRARRVAGLVDIAPDEAWRPLRQPVHQRQIVREIGHAPIVDLVTDATDVELCKLMVGWLLHGAYSAASRTAPCESALREYSSMRRSISGRKCRSNPCTGQAAPSPKAQMVWPSICLVTSNSMSISRFCARPSAIRVRTRHIQPMPSRHGVHWPQLSCL